MDTPHLFRLVSIGSNQGRPLEPERLTYIHAFAAYDVWMALGSRHNVPPTSVHLVLEPPGAIADELVGDLYELPHHGRAADLRPVRSRAAPKPAPKRRR